MSGTSAKAAAPAVLKIVGAVLLVIAIQVGAAFAISAALPGWQERGWFGDMFGAVNTLFSGLALAAVAYALVLQSRELALQREELKATREEVRKSVAAQEALAAVAASQYELESRTLDEAERSSRERLTPRFTRRGLGTQAAVCPWRLMLTMDGERIRDVTAVSEVPGFELYFSPRESASPGGLVSLAGPMGSSQAVPFILRYVDSAGRRRRTRYTVVPDKGKVTYLEEATEPDS